MKTLVSQNPDGPLIVELHGECSIYDAAEMKAQFVDVLSQKRPVIVDLAGVLAMDTSIAQVLIAVTLEARRTHTAISLKNHTPAVLNLFSLFGLVDFFGDVVQVPQGFEIQFPYGASNGLLAAQ